MSTLDFHTILILPCWLQLIWQLCNTLHRPSLSPSPKRQHLGAIRREIIVKDGLEQSFYQFEVQKI